MQATSGQRDCFLLLPHLPDLLCGQQGASPHGESGSRTSAQAALREAAEGKLVALLSAEAGVPEIAPETQPQAGLTRGECLHLLSFRPRDLALVALRSVLQAARGRAELRSSLASYLSPEADNFHTLNRK